MNISTNSTSKFEIVYISGALTGKSHSMISKTDSYLPFERHVHLDVSGVTRVTSGGIRSLIHIYRMLCESNHTVTLCGESHEFNEMLWLTGFTECLRN
jgi:ABC-type transporter Mla MlaB component